jgi:hypothetical protein
MLTFGKDELLEGPRTPGLVVAVFSAIRRKIVRPKRWPLKPELTSRTLTSGAPSTRPNQSENRFITNSEFFPLTTLRRLK